MGIYIADIWRLVVDEEVDAIVVREGVVEVRDWGWRKEIGGRGDWNEWSEGRM